MIVSDLIGILQNYQFTDLEIVSLWNSFRVDFPEGQITRPQMKEVVKKIFPK